MAGTDQRDATATAAAATAATATAATAVEVEQHPHEPLVWEPPGPGAWSLDKAHIPRPCTTLSTEIAPEAFRIGFEEMFRTYGIPAQDSLNVFVNGFSYGRIVPLPPAELEARAQAADEALRTRRWRDDLQRWETEAKPEALRRHRELVAIDVDALPVEGLIAHLRECCDHVASMVVQHHRFNGAAMVPLGDLLAGVHDWTDGAVTGPEVLALLAGASPVSRGDCPELRAVTNALEADPRACALLDDRDDADPAEVLDALRDPSRVDAATVAAVDEWITLVGHRILDGFDVYHPRAIERPQVLVSCLRTAHTAVAPAPEPDVGAVRDRIPPEQRDEFDDRLTEARLTYRLRDERGIYSDATAIGIMRRAMLAAGTRLAAEGRLPSPELAVAAGLDELVALLDEHPSAPEVEVLKARARFRAAHVVDEAPPHLGDPPSPPPPFELLPPAMARMTRAVLTLTGNMSAPEAGEELPPNTLRGVAASPGRHEGTARIVHDVDDLLRVEEGDVIVAVTTAESFNLAMSFAAAVVTDQGGLLGHAAITAREYGIPAVVGTHRATTAIADGTRVTVDGSTGEVSW